MKRRTLSIYYLIFYLRTVRHLSQLGRNSYFKFMLFWIKLYQFNKISLHQEMLLLHCCIHYGKLYGIMIVPATFSFLCLSKVLWHLPPSFDKFWGFSPHPRLQIGWFCFPKCDPQPVTHAIVTTDQSPWGQSENSY